MGFPCTHLKSILQEALNISIRKTSLKNKQVKLIRQLSGASGLIIHTYLFATTHRAVCD